MRTHKRLNAFLIVVLLLACLRPVCPSDPCTLAEAKPLPTSQSQSRSALPPSDNHAENPLHRGEVPIHLCKHNSKSADTVFGKSVFSVTNLFVAPHPLYIGKGIDFLVEGQISNNLIPENGLSSEFILLQVAYSTSAESLSQETQRSSAADLRTDLCSALGFRSKGNSSNCPRIHRKNVSCSTSRKQNNVTMFAMASQKGLTLPGRDYLQSGIFDIEINLNTVLYFNLSDVNHLNPRSQKPSDGGYKIILESCAGFQLVFMYSWLDFVPAITSFIIASAASWHLGKAFLYIRLPLITGYLLIGVVVGPYVCNLVTRYHVWLLGQFINDVALSFISFAAGEEIFFPELKAIMKPMLRHMFSITIFTLLFCSQGFFFATSRVIGTATEKSGSFIEGNEWASDQDTNCRIAIALLVAVIMVARSPATVVAVTQELRAEGPIAKMVTGVTVMSDVVVLVGFALVNSLASALCPVPGANGYDTHSFDAIAVLIVIAQFIAIAVVGFASGALLLIIMWLPFERFKIFRFQILRSHLKGALIIPLGYLIFHGLRSLSKYTLDTTGREFSVEPLMVCMIAASIAGHRSGDKREQFANILEKAAPYIFLPFFTLTGASLALDQISTAMPLALLLVLIRAFAILCAIYTGSGPVPSFIRCCCLRYKSKKSRVRRGDDAISVDSDSEETSQVSTRGPAASPFLSMESPMESFATQESKKHPAAQMSPEREAMNENEHSYTSTSNPALTPRSILRSFWLSLAMLSQAGVALGLALETKARFPRWGGEFATLILAVVVLNQVFGPPLCKIGLSQLIPKGARLILTRSEQGRSSSTAALDLRSLSNGIFLSDTEMLYQPDVARSPSYVSSRSASIHSEVNWSIHRRKQKPEDATSVRERNYAASVGSVEASRGKTFVQRESFEDEIDNSRLQVLQDNNGGLVTRSASAYSGLSMTPKRFDSSHYASIGSPHDLYI